jgi:uncharacterized membrane protein
MRLPWIFLALLLGVARPLSATPFAFTSIDFPGAFDTTAAGINSSGHIVGSSFSFSSGSTGFLLSAETLTVIGFPPPGGRGINNADELVGYDNVQNRGFLWREGKLSTIDFPGASTTSASDINDAGQVTGSYYVNGTDGFHSFLLSDGIFTTIDFPGAYSTTAWGINNLGQIVGDYSVSVGDSNQGFIFSGGAFTTINFPGASLTSLSGINNFGQIVGSYYLGGYYHGFLLSGGTFTTTDFPGAIETGASGINDVGQIVGRYRKGFIGGSGFVASPAEVAEPGSLSLLLVGAPCIFGIKRAFRR